MVPGSSEITHITGQYTLATLTWQALAMGNNDNGGPYMTREGLAAMPKHLLSNRKLNVKLCTKVSFLNG